VFVSPVDLDPNAELAPVPRSTLRGMRRQLTVTYHGLRTWIRSPGWKGKAILTTLSVGLLVYPLLRLGWKQSVGFSAVWFIVAAWKAWRELSPKHMQILQRNYLQRKLALYRLLQILPDALGGSPDQVREFQLEALRLVAQYVRDHRVDVKGTQIFANLLVEDGDDMVVVARDQTHREHSARCFKRHMLAWLALTTGEPQITGDVYADYPETMPGKPYRSILVIPVKVGRRVLGVISIDSSRRYHFDRDFQNLVEYVNPYIALLGWTIDPERGKTPMTSLGRPS
jgi:GAF domain-containing protein